MPSGIADFIKLSESSKARSAANQAQSSNSPRIDYFGIKDGQRALVRFLEQGDDINYAQTHRVVFNPKYAEDVVCLDQKNEGVPCPLCHADNVKLRKRSVKGFLNIIWRGNEDLQEANQALAQESKKQFTLGPVYKINDKGYYEKDSNGNKIITGFADSIFLLKCTKTVLELLIDKDAKYHGLMSRDFEISRQGSQMEDTKYFVEPAYVDGGPQPMLAPDMALFSKKYDVKALASPKTYEEVEALINGPAPTIENPIQSAGTDVFSGGPPVRSSAFAR